MRELVATTFPGVHGDGWWVEDPSVPYRGRSVGVEADEEGVWFAWLYQGLGSDADFCMMFEDSGVTRRFESALEALNAAADGWFGEDLDRRVVMA